MMTYLLRLWSYQLEYDKIILSHGNNISAAFGKEG